MCHWSSYEYDKRLSADPTRSFFQALRDLFRATPKRQVEAEVVPLPVARAAAPTSQSDRPKAA